MAQAFHSCFDRELARCQVDNVLYEQDMTLMDPLRCLLPTDKEYIINEEVKAWCEKIEDKGAIAPTIGFIA